MASCFTSSGTAELLVGKSSSAEQPVPHSASAGSSEQQPAVCAEQPAKQENANMMVAHLQWHTHEVTNAAYEIES